MALTKPAKKVAKAAALDSGARPPLMTVAEVAEYLGVTRKHVYHTVQHEMPVIQMGRNLRFDPIDVYVYAERLKRRPQ